MAKDSLTVTIKIDGLRETLRAFRDLPKSASNEIRNESLQIARGLANRIRASASSRGHQARLLAATVGAVSDRVPSVKAGGSTPLGRHRKPAYKLLFGSEFGAKYLKQFQPRNLTGYWFYPTVDDYKDEMATRWLEAADIITTKWAEQ